MKQHKFFHILIIAFSSLIFFAACGEDRVYQYEELTANNKAILNLMEAYYLWADDIDTDLDWKEYFGDGDDFFDDLLVSNDDWSFATIDTVSSDPFARGHFNHLNSYGMDYSIITDPTNATSRYYMRVLMVEPGSPADDAGIKRNDYISHIDDSRVSSSSSLESGTAKSITISHIEYDSIEEMLYWTDTTVVEMPASRYVEDYPFLNYSIINDESGKIAYIMVTRLTPGPIENDSLSTKYRDDMDKIFTSFKQQGATDLIVDLRYCNNGNIDMAQRLASYIAGDDSNGNKFITTFWNANNESNNSAVYFDTSLTNGNELNLSRVCFITSDYTTGAAEWMIHALQCELGESNVIIVGSQTSGQNVLTNAYETGYYVTINPAVAYVGDANGDYDYSDGIQPTETITESGFVYFYPFGDINENMVAAAIAKLKE